MAELRSRVRTLKLELRLTEFPTSPETLTAEFLSEALDLQVSDVRCEEMRIHLTYADGGAA